MTFLVRRIYTMSRATYFCGVSSFSSVVPQLNSELLSAKTHTTLH